MGHHVLDTRWLCGKNFSSVISLDPVNNELVIPYSLDFLWLLGSSHVEQLPNVPAYNEPWVDNGVDLGEKGSDMVDGGVADNGARRLLQVQRKHSSLLQEKPHCCGFDAWCSLQPTVYKLLQRWGCGCLGTRPSSCYFSLSA